MSTVREEYTPCVINQKNSAASVNMGLKSVSEIAKIFIYTFLLFPVVIFVLEMSFLLLNKSNNKFVSETIFDSLTGWRNNCDEKNSNPENLNFLILMDGSQS